MFVNMLLANSSKLTCRSSEIMSKSTVKTRTPKTSASRQSKAEQAHSTTTKQTPAKKVSEKKASAKKSSPLNADSDLTLSLGDLAHTVLAKQYKRLVKQEADVLKDKDPEHLHQMRVATRRLRTGLKVFDAVVQLPKPAREKQVQALAKVLGQLRDLDVQSADLRDRYRPQVPASEQALIDQCLKQLSKQRVDVFEQVESKLTGSQYQRLKAAYKDWLDQSVQPSLAQISVVTALPDLLNPLISDLLLHPGWWVAASERDTAAGALLHDLRKTCKQARYQTEFFADFYRKAFTDWMDELKQIQEKLGTLQDTHVLLDLLADYGASAKELPELYAAVAQQQAEVMADWDQLRSRYLEQSFRRSLYQMILTPTT
jgi:CHAD domain-containing protein